MGNDSVPPTSPRTLPRVLLAGLILLAIIGGTAYFYYRQPKPTAATKAPEIGPAIQRTATASRIPGVRFTDVTKQAGITFRHTNGATDKKLLPETMGSGVAFIDYDGDGRQDILFVNSCYWPGQGSGKPKPTLTLYRNKGDGTFEDVTAAAGLAVTMFGMGVTVGDYDNDGWPDLFVTGVGGNRLFHNVKGRFADVTREAGVGGPGNWPLSQDFEHWQPPVNFSASAAFLDYDGDGRLDLFVCNYVVWSPEIDLRQGFSLEGVGRAYGPPKAFEGSHCFLYRNLGGGRFEDATAKAGIPVSDQLGRLLGKSLGVVACDVDEDGWPDIVVANDTVRNFFFHNKKDGTFEEIGERSGVAYAEGSARGAMGIDFGECRSGKCALLITNFSTEPNTFLRLENQQKLFFADAAVAERIAGPSRLPLKFGAFFFDYDLDGRNDVLTCNGHLEPEIAKVQVSQSYKQPVQLYWNTGKGFEPVTADQCGPDLFVPLVGRGCAYADIDGDGDLDVVLTENGGPARLLRNEGGTGNHWVRLVLEGDGQRSNRSAIGARVILEAGGVTQRRHVTSARGYLSQSELPVTFGLGKTDRVDRVTIHWPGKDAGPPTVLKDVAVDRVHTIKQRADK
jgi:hypothetical protein